jgi:hypothetical protein
MALDFRRAERLVEIGRQAVDAISSTLQDMQRFQIPDLSRLVAAGFAAD